MKGRLELKRVLIVEDHRDVREVLRRFLEMMSVDSLVADSGEAALACFGENANGIDLVILDWTLPGISGAETFRAIESGWPDVPIVICSGMRGLIEKEAPRSTAGFLHKPFSPADLKRILDATLGA